MIDKNFSIKYSLIVLLIGMASLLFLDSAVMAKEQALKSSILSTNEMKIIQDSILHGNPQLKSKPVHLDTLTTDEMGEAKHIVTFFRFTDLGEDKLFLVVSKFKKDQKIEVLGSFLVNNLIKVGKGVSYGFLSSIYHITNKDVAMVLIVKSLTDKGYMQHLNKQAVVIKIGNPSRVIGTMPYGCSLSSNKCLTDDLLICDYQQNNSAQIKIDFNRNGYGVFKLDFDINRQDVIDGVEKNSETKKSISFTFNKATNSYGSKQDLKEYTCPIN
ncbi:MAG: hypothetical protein JJV97_04585 [SAR324 cluster bacterium]|nr:hypothetical protein [SAR324 cluster bacterium]